MRIPAYRVAALAWASLLAIGLAACASTSSSASFKGEDHEVAQTISNFQADARNGDEQKVCANDLAGAVVARLSSAPGGCEQAIKTQLSEADGYEVNVKSVQVSATGAHPTASAGVTSVNSGKTRASTVLLVKEAGKWKISGLQ